MDKCKDIWKNKPKSANNRNEMVPAKLTRLPKITMINTTAQLSIMDKNTKANIEERVRKEITYQQTVLLNLTIEGVIRSFSIKKTIVKAQ